MPSDTSKIVNVRCEMWGHEPIHSFFARDMGLSHISHLTFVFFKVMEFWKILHEFQKNLHEFWNVNDVTFLGRLMQGRAGRFLNVSFWLRRNSIATRQSSSKLDFALAAQNFNIWNYFDTKLAKSLEGCEIMSTFASAIPGKHKAVGGWPK